MTSSDWAAWVGAIGTVLAAGIAVWLYWQSRRDAKADLAARRRVLHAMLRQHVTNAADFVRQNAARIDTPEFRKIDVGLRMILLSLENVDRLVELQAKLMDFGEEGDADIAVFIEACRQYHKTQSGWSKYASDSRLVQTAPTEDGTHVHLGMMAITSALHRVAETVDPALKAIERFDVRAGRVSVRS